MRSLNQKTAHPDRRTTGTAWIRRLHAGELLLASAALIVSQAFADLNPSLLARVPGGLYGINGVAIDGNYLYTANNDASPSGLMIFDISAPAHPVQIYGDTYGWCGGVVASSGYAYAIHGFDLYILDVSNPTNPVAAALIPGSWTDVEIYRNRLLLSGYDGVYIYDVADPRHPARLGLVAPGADGAALSGNYAYLAVNWTGLVVYEISDPAKPVRVAQTNDPRGLAFDVAVSGKYAYLSAFTNGLWVYDISNPTNPAPVFHLIDDVQSVTISGNYAFLGGCTRVLDISQPGNPTVAGSISLGGGYPLAVSRNLACLNKGDYAEIYSLGLQPPPLTIANTTTNALLLSWPTPTGAFVVQQNLDINSTNWITLTNAAVVGASRNQVTVPNPESPMFYRLCLQ